MTKVWSSDLTLTLTQMTCDFAYSDTKDKNQSYKKMTLFESTQ